MKDEPATIGAAMAAANAEAEKDYRHRQLRRNFIGMGRRAASEIKHLRAQVEALRPKAEAYDTITKIVGVAVGNGPQGYSEDIAWLIEREIEKVEADNTKPESTEDQLVEVDPRVPDPTRHAHEV